MVYVCAERAKTTTLLIMSEYGRMLITGGSLGPSHSSSTSGYSPCWMWKDAWQAWAVPLTTQLMVLLTMIFAPAGLQLQQRSSRTQATVLNTIDRKEPSLETYLLRTETFPPLIIAETWDKKLEKTPTLRMYDFRDRTNPKPRGPHCLSISTPRMYLSLIHI